MIACAPDRSVESSPQVYARVGGALYLIVIVAGLFAQRYAHSCRRGAHGGHRKTKMRLTRLMQWLRGARGPELPVGRIDSRRGSIDGPCAGLYSAVNDSCALDDILAIAYCDGTGVIRNSP